MIMQLVQPIFNTLLMLKNMWYRTIRECTMWNERAREECSHWHSLVSNKRGDDWNERWGWKRFSKLMNGEVGINGGVGIF